MSGISETQCSIHLKIGHLDVEAVGPVSYIKDDLSEVISKLVRLYVEDEAVKQILSKSTTPTPKAFAGTGLDGLAEETVTSIANKLSCNSGSDLIVAASAYLTLVVGKAIFSRKELLQNMQAGGAYYKDSYRDNLSSYLQRLIKDDVLRTQGSDYKLSPTALKDFEAKIV